MREAMTLADSIFEFAGYRKNFSNDTRQIYEKKKSNHTSHIIFNLYDRSIEVARYDKNGRHQNKTITALQLKAILKKIEELGWRL
jgi:hypothetical protein